MSAFAMFLTGSVKYFGANTLAKIIISRKSKQRVNMLSANLKKSSSFDLNFLFNFGDLERHNLKVHHLDVITY